MKLKRIIILALCIVGICVSSYLAYAKLSSNPLVCAGNLGCNIVQNSKYSTLLGIPIGVFGMGYYFFIFTLMYINPNKTIRFLRNISIIWGILFSLYLTYLEAFVIRAYCMWCLISFANIILISILYFIGKEKKILEKIQ